jgi:hypothetical protein
MYQTLALILSILTLHLTNKCWAQEPTHTTDSLETTITPPPSSDNYARYRNIVPEFTTSTTIFDGPVTPPPYSDSSSEAGFTDPPPEPSPTDSLSDSPPPNWPLLGEISTSDEVDDYPWISTSTVVVTLIAEPAVIPIPTRTLTQIIAPVAYNDLGDIVAPTVGSLTGSVPQLSGTNDLSSPVGNAIVPIQSIPEALNYQGQDTTGGFETSTIISVGYGTIGTIVTEVHRTDSASVPPQPTGPGIK